MLLYKFEPFFKEKKIMVLSLSFFRSTPSFIIQSYSKRSTIFILKPLKRSYTVMNNMSLETGSTVKRIETQIYGKAKNGVDMKIVLTEKETDICNLLKKVSDYIASERPDLPRIESRIAGGWVRDKVIFFTLFPLKIREKKR